MSEPLSIDLIKIDGDTQSRLSISEETVEEYAEKIADDEGEWNFPPLDVFHDGTDYYLADGFHRLLAAERAKRSSVPCTIRRGTAKDAKIFGMTANDTHGLRMTRADKRACVEWLLDNGGKLTQKDIAAKAGVTTRTVRYIVAERQADEKRKFSAEQNGTTKSEKVQIAPFGGEQETSSDQGKPGGASTSSSNTPPVSDETTCENFSEESEPTPEAHATEPQEGAGDSEPEKPVRGKSTEKSPAKLVDDLTKSHVGHIARGLTNIAEVNGGEGEQFHRADAGLNELIGALQEMREGAR